MLVKGAPGAHIHHHVQPHIIRPATRSVINQHLRYWPRVHVDFIQLTCSALLALYEGNPPVTADGFPSQRPVAWGFDVFLYHRLKKRLNNHSKRRWFDTPPHSLWCHCNAFHTILPNKDLYRKMVIRKGDYTFFSDHQQPVTKFSICKNAFRAMLIIFHKLLDSIPIIKIILRLFFINIALRNLPSRHTVFMSSVRTSVSLALHIHIKDESNVYS